MTTQTRRLIWEAYLMHVALIRIAQAFGVKVGQVEMVIRRRGR